MDTAYWTVGEVATYFGKSQKWVYKHQAEIPGRVIVCGSILFDIQLLKDGLKKLSNKSVTAPTVCHNRHGL